MRQITQDLLLRILFPNVIVLSGIHLWWLHPVVAVAGVVNHTVSTMLTLCFWHSIPEVLWAISIVVIGVSLYLQFRKEFKVRHIYVDAFRKLMDPGAHHGAMALIMLFILVTNIVVRLYPVAVVQGWVNAPQICVEYQSADRNNALLKKSTCFSEYTISIMHWSRVLCILHTTAHTFLYLQPAANLELTRDTISKVTIEGVAHVYEGTRKFRWTSMCANKEEHKLYLCLLSCMILLGWWLWPGPEADEHDWYTAHLNMLYGPLECILQRLCEYVWKDELSLIEKPEFSLILQVLAFVCCLWLLCLADVEPLPCTHTTCETVNGRQLALAINNGIFDIWGVIFNSIMSEDVPCAFEHPVHGAAVTFDVSEG